MPPATLIAGTLLLAATSALAADIPRQHVETATSSRHEYRLEMGGTVDAENTRDPIVVRAPHQGFQPMRFVRIENTGDVEIVNPWILVNGRRDWRSPRAMVSEALRAFGEPAKMSDAEKARSLWEFVRRHRFHASTGDFEVRDPVKQFNVYGYSLCGDNAHVLMDLWRLAGLKVRRGFPIGHCVAEVWYDGGWHLFDADLSVFFLDRDNRTIVSEKAVVHDHDLAKRAYADQYAGALYGYGGTHTGDYASHAGHTMNLALRPGEALEWRWGHEGKHHYAREPVLYNMANASQLSRWGPEAWASLCNGRWIYTPPLGTRKIPTGVTAQNIRWSTRPDGPAVGPSRAGEPAAMTWRIDTPYAIVGGRVTAEVRIERDALCSLLISLDGVNWQSIADVPRERRAKVNASLDSFLSPRRGPPPYGYYIRAEFRADSEPEDVGLDRITIENDLQMAVLSLPALERGDNIISYTAETEAPHSAQVTFAWVERSAISPPHSPVRPIHPLHGAEVEGTALTFQWDEAQPRAGDRIVDYQFQLGDEPVLRWALSPSFERPTNGAVSFILARPGLLTPGRRYYWRVRAKSDKGVWSAWSGIWNFVPSGPALPINPRFESREPDVFTLAWDVSTAGRRPTGFRIYASNEKGFTCSDADYEVAVGNQLARGLFPGKTSATFPANFVTAVTENAFAFRPTCAFHRVVAVDERGNRSGPSAYVAAPRPFIHTDPPRVAKIGVTYDYQPRTVASIGDLTYRDFGGDEHYQAAFWDAERPRYSFEPEAPRCGNRPAEWLVLDPNTGRLGGTPRPADAGELLVNLKVEIPGVGSHVQSFPLQVVP